MAKPEIPGRKSVTSDPDRGVAVNSGTDPQRPGKPARAVPDPSAERTPSREDARPAPAPSRNEDVEHGGRSEPDDPV